MGEDPAASWLTYAVMGAGFLLGALGALLVKGTRRRRELLEQLIHDKETELMNSPGIGEPVPTLIPLTNCRPCPQPKEVSKMGEGRWRAVLLALMMTVLLLPLGAVSAEETMEEGDWRLRG